MTCIVGLQTESGTVIGADSLGCAENNKTVRSDVKVFRSGPFLLGFTGSFRIMQVVRYRPSWPAQREGASDHEYLCTDFVDAIRQALRESGCLKRAEEVEAGAAFLLAYKGQLYEGESDFQIGIPKNGMAATGCGFAYALGALASLTGSDPKWRVAQALETASQFDTFVGAPFVVRSQLRGGQ